MLSNIKNILLKDFIFFIFIIIISTFYYLLNSSLILFVLLILLFSLLNFYLISTLNYELDSSIENIKNTFFKAVNSNIILLKKVRKLYQKSFSLLQLKSSFYYLFSFKNFLFKFTALRSNTKFLGFLNYYYSYYLILNKVKKKVILLKG